MRVAQFIGIFIALTLLFGSFLINDPFLKLILFVEGLGVSLIVASTVWFRRK